MAGLFQGDPLPALTKTTEQQQVAPEFYTNYLQDIANLGQNAIQQGGIAGFSPLQQQALSMAPNVAFSGSGSLGAASRLLGEAGATTVPDVIADYMNPYTQAVVGEMGRLQQRNIRENVLPNLAGAAVGTGQFGSRRQAQVTGQALRDLQSDLIGKQLGALQQGYTEAGKFAQTDLERALNAGRSFTSLGQEQQQLGVGGLKTLFDYGGQEQALGQKMLDYPMAQAQAFGKLLQGYQIPTGTVQQTTGSEGYSNSPLAQIAGLLTGLGAFLRSEPGKAKGGVMRKAKGGGVRKPPMAATMRGKGYRVGGSVYEENLPARSLTQKEIDQIIEASKPKPARSLTPQEIDAIIEGSKPKPFRMPVEDILKPSLKRSNATNGYADGGAIAYTDGMGHIYDTDGNLVR